MSFMFPFTAGSERAVCARAVGGSVFCAQIYRASVLFLSDLEGRLIQLG